jgi:Methyltransferase domain
MNLALALNRALARVNLALVRKTSLSALEFRANQVVQNVKTENAEVFCTSNESIEKLLVTELTGLRSRIDLLQVDLNKRINASKWELVDQIRANNWVTESKRTCPLCEQSGDSALFKKLDSHCIFGGGVLTRHQCPFCDVIFGADKMLALSPQELAEDYVWHYRSYQEGDSTGQEIRAFEALKPNKNGIYLNYGAGSWSNSVKELRSQGWNVLAYEPHSSAAASEEFVITSAAQLSSLTLDGVYSNNVLEHLRYPEKELAWLAQLLRPGAKQVHATPCFEYLYEYTRFHLFFYLGRSRQVLAKKSGLLLTDYTQDGEFLTATFEKEIQ